MLLGPQQSCVDMAQTLKVEQLLSVSGGTRLDVKGLCLYLLVYQE